MGKFLPVCKTGDIPDPGKKVFEVGGQFVVVFHVEGRFWALDDCCTHDDGPLGEGELDGHAIACPRHGAKFDIRDGRVLSMPATRPTPAYSTKVDNDIVYVEVEE